MQGERTATLISPLPIRFGGRRRSILAPAGTEEILRGRLRIRVADPTAQGMHTIRAAAAAPCLKPVYIAVRHADGRGALGKCAVVELQWAIAVETAQRTDAISYAGGKDREFGTVAIC